MGWRASCWSSGLLCEEDGPHVLSRESQAEVEGPGDGVGGFQVRALRTVSLWGISDTCSHQERLCVSFSRF